MGQQAYFKIIQTYKKLWKLISQTLKIIETNGFQILNSDIFKMKEGFYLNK